MAYQHEEIDFMSPMRLFLENPPFLKPFETLTINYMKIDPTAPGGTGNAIAIAGTPRPTMIEDVNGDIFLQQEINWVFYMQRFTNDDGLNRDIGNFIANYNLWINTSQALRQQGFNVSNIPKFGDTETETILASGGMGTGSTETQNVDEFQIQIHIKFEKLLEKSEY